MGTLNRNGVKYIRPLELKKNRKEGRVFLTEDPKLVGDLLRHFPCEFLTATSEWLREHSATRAMEVIEVDPEGLSRTSLLKSPQQVLALFEQPKCRIDTEVVHNSLCLASDDIQDPGGLGAAIRLADWFDIERIFCSSNTVDVFSPKAIQATMKGIARVKIRYIALPGLVHILGSVLVYGTSPDGKDIYEQPLSKNGVIVVGNEENGIGAEVEKLANRKLHIPNYLQEREASESLDITVATVIVCAEFRRQAAL